MNTPTASAVTWSMTGTGRSTPRSGLKPKYSTRVCVKCRCEYEPTGGKQKFCSACVPKLAYRKPQNASATALDAAPDDPDAVAKWAAETPYRNMDSVWVALFVEQFAHDGNRAAMARALVNIRRRYRASIAEPQAVE